MNKLDETKCEICNEKSLTLDRYVFVGLDDKNLMVQCTCFNCGQKYDIVYKKKEVVKID